MFLVCAAVQPAAAETLTLQWDPSPDAKTAGYAVFVSTTLGTAGTGHDTGLTRTFAWDAAPGQQLYFCVAAYDAGQVLGPCSAQIARYPNSPPTLQDPGPQTTTTGTAVSFRLIGSDPEGAPITYGASALPPGLQIAPNTGVISGSPSTVGSYVVTATASDGALAVAKSFTWTIVAPSTSSEGGSSDGSSEGSSSTGETSEGSGSDDSTSGTSSPESREDTTAPTLRITIPTASGAWATDRAFVTIGGRASDNVGVRGVEWRSDRGGSGDATGTQTWLAAIPLVRGINIITVRAYDAAGNTATKTIRVKYAPKFR
jgi:hypothetical protein